MIFKLILIPQASAQFNGEPQASAKFSGKPQASVRCSDNGHASVCCGDNASMWLNDQDAIIGLSRLNQLLPTHSAVNKRLRKKQTTSRRLLCAAVLRSLRLVWVF